ncbi:hypothetical protein [Streptomyces sp. UNOC14_S4]|uniref:hypothetical protein n=1 Tax=Streptomyces sp. UNOC14_S4 TaxID=2872340 RepID=UPI001E413129|nr:hypothetical protein [Streptomyces sp. UNOC14_S4]MCC3766496.1 hypothetical protein [Streptomyces sp. UNOC14_S4]
MDTAKARDLVCGDIIWLTDGRRVEIMGDPVHHADGEVVVELWELGTNHENFGTVLKQTDSYIYERGHG